MRVGQCPRCGKVMRAGAAKCPDCGYSRPEPKPTWQQQPLVKTAIIAAVITVGGMLVGTLFVSCAKTEVERQAKERAERNRLWNERQMSTTEPSQ